MGFWDQLLDPSVNLLTSVFEDKLFIYFFIDDILLHFLVIFIYENYTVFYLKYGIFKINSLGNIFKILSEFVYLKIRDADTKTHKIYVYSDKPIIQLI